MRFCRRGGPIVLQWFIAGLLWNLRIVFGIRMPCARLSAPPNFRRYVLSIGLDAAKMGEDAGRDSQLGLTARRAHCSSRLSALYAGPGSRVWALFPHQ